VSSARTIQLPPFLVDLLRKHLIHHKNQFVFTAPHGGWLRRRDFNRRVFKPAVEGDLKRGLAPIRPGLTFHGLRHSHKTWLANDLIQPIASAKRLGHHVPDKLEEVYTHVAPKMERQILKQLQGMWQHAQHAAVRPVDNRPLTRHDTLTHRSRARATRADAGVAWTDSPQVRPVQPVPMPAHRPRPTNAGSTSTRTESAVASRAHHRVGALRSTPAVPRRSAPPQITAMRPHRPATREGMVILQKPSSNPPEHDHGHEHVSIIKRMKKSPPTGAFAAVEEP
jgi:hypothetical protein